MIKGKGFRRFDCNNLTLTLFLDFGTLGTNTFDPESDVFNRNLKD